MNNLEKVNSNDNSNEYNYNEYYIIKDNIIYKILILKTNKKIIIKYKNYQNILDSNIISNLTKSKVEPINDAYKNIINIFEENKVSIKTFSLKKEIKLILKLNNKNIEVVLLYDENNYNDFIFNEIKAIKKELLDIKYENNKLKEEINILKKFHSDENPKDIQLITNLTKDSYSDDSGLVNTFATFNSIKNISYLIYSNRNKSIICYDLNEEKIIKEIKTYSNKYITSIKHYLDDINKRDIIMSISSDENNIKLWDINNWDLILNIQKVNNKGYLFSGCFLNENNENYIVSSNLDWNNNIESIKIFDFKGNKIKEINDSNDKTMYIESYFDKNLQKNYILTCNENYIKSYDYINNKIYHKYYDNENGTHNSFIIKDNEEIIKIIESCNDGNIRIWNFHSGLLLNKIKVINKPLIDICLWNNSYLFIGCKDNSIKLIDIKSGLIVKSLSGHNQTVLTIRKIKNQKFGECLISQGYMDDQIKLWANKN